MYVDIRGKRAGILTRISDDREGKALGVKRQEDDGRRLAAQLGLSVYRLYIENDISASPIANEDRHEFDEFMRDWQAGRFDVPLAYTTGRLTRNNIVAERIISIAQQCGISPHYIASPWFDLNTAAGRRSYRAQAVNDLGESEDIQERVTRKKLQDAREGKPPGGPRTYGYGPVIGIDPRTHKEIRDYNQVVPQEHATLLEGKSRLFAGDSQFTIIQDWNGRGLRTVRAGQVIKYKGTERICDGLWKVGKFKRTMLNECYVRFDAAAHPTDCPCLENPEGNGTRVHHGNRHRATWPAVFTRAEHEAMRAIFNGREKYWSNAGRLKGRTYLLSGFVECGGTWKNAGKQGTYCGGQMYGQGKVYDTKQGRIYQRRYACKKWDRDGSRIGCCTVFRYADAVEAYVTEQVLYRFDSPEIARALAPTDNESRMAEIIQQFGELQLRREQLAAEYANGEHEKDDYRIMLSTVKEKLAALESEKKRLLSDQAKHLSLPLAGGLRELWQTASIAWQASVMKLVVEKVIIHPSSPGRSKWVSAEGEMYNFKPEDVEIVWLH